MSRTDILNRVRRAVEQGRAYRVHLDPVPADAGYVGAAGDLCDALAVEIKAVGGMSQVVDTWDAARVQVLDWLRHHRVRSALCWRHPALEKLGIEELLKSEGIARYRHDELAALDGPRQLEVLLRADAGISSADFAVAETGTLAVCAAAGQERTTSLVPPVHLAIVEQTQIVPDLFDLFRCLEPGRDARLPSAVALISGPSKTGDIELELTTGVHGPGTWLVLIVRAADPVGRG